MQKTKAFIAALLGTIVEHYDYALYGYMAAVLSDRFFPSDEPSVALLKHFAVFALGFVAKPLGAYIFGRIGDTYGRKYALRWSIMGIAIPTAIVGLLPSYNEWGWVAPALLIICRIAQGMFISAEADGVGIFIYETVPKARACLANSLVWISATLGGGMAAYVSGVALQEHFPAWAWRVPFFIGGVLGVVTVWFRQYLMESFDYVLYKANPQSVFLKSFFNVVWHNKVPVLLAIMVSGSVSGTYYFYLVFWNNYLYKILNMCSASEACFKASFLMKVYTIVAPICGYMADYFKLLPTLKLSFFLCLVMLLVNGIALSVFNTMPTWIMASTTIAFVLFHIPAFVLLVKMFSIGERYRCMSMGHALGSMLMGGSTPGIATYFWRKLEHPAAPLIYCGLLMCIGFAGVMYAKAKQDYTSFYTNPNSKGLAAASAL